MPRHPQYDAKDRLAILLHGGITGIHGKTGLALLRFAPERCVAVIDRQTAGGNLAELTGIPFDRPIPIVASAQEALVYKPQTLALGLAALGGKLPEDWIPDMQTALAGGLNILNGLHTALSNDPRLASHVQHGKWIWDIRKEPAGLVSGMGLARLLPLQAGALCRNRHVDWKNVRSDCISSSGSQQGDSLEVHGNRTNRRDARRGRNPTGCDPRGLCIRGCATRADRLCQGSRRRVHRGSGLTSEPSINSHSPPTKRITANAFGPRAPRSNAPLARL